MATNTLVRSLFMSSAELGSTTCERCGPVQRDGREHVGLERIVGVREGDADLVAARVGLDHVGDEQHLAVQQPVGIGERG